MSDRTLSTEEGKIEMSIECQTDLSAKQYHFVKLDSNNLVVIAGANDKSAGILQNAPNGSAAAPVTAVVRVQGVSKLKVSETVAFGKFLTPTAAGLGEVCDAPGEEFGARAYTSGDANDLAQVLIAHGEVTASDA